MKNTNLNQLSIIVCCVAFLTLALGSHVLAQSTKSGNLKTEIVSVHQLSSFAVVPQTGASLSRNTNAVLGTISTSGLTPGHVITFWWAIYNNPEYCANPSCAPSDLNNPAVNGSLQFGGGTFADAGGRATFMGYLEKGDNTGLDRKSTV